jgi:BirA family biotin operon repressor/biotin-[acetyl-CoA-carboxylase] ligase
VSAVSCAALWAVTEVAGVTLRLKWPNDLVVVGIGDPAGPDGGDRKVAGVLAEARPVAGGRTATAIGVGVNCNWGAMPEALADIGTSLDLLCGRAVDTEELAATIVRGFDDRLSLLDTAEGAAALVAEARAHSATLGRRVHVELPGGGFEGTAAALAADGALEVTLDDGSTRTVLAGDVVHLRPT